MALRSSVEFKYLTFEEVMESYEFIIDNTGGDKGLINQGNLEFTLSHIIDYDFGETDHEKKLIRKSSFLVWNIIDSHPFTDGNKRAGLNCLLTFLSINSYYLDADQDELFEFTLKTALKEYGFEEVNKFIENHLKHE